MSHELKVKEIPVPLKNKHDPVKYDILPSHEFTIGIIAPAG